MEDTRVCAKCAAIKSIDDFKAWTKNKVYTSTICKECANIRKSAAVRKRKSRSLEYYFRTLIQKKDRKSLDLEWIQAQWKRQKGLCYWTKQPMNIEDFNRKPSIDRLRPGEPYTPDNCVLTQYSINLMRNTTSFFDLARYLYELGVTRC